MYVFLGICLCLLSFKSHGDDDPRQRPLDPFVYEGALDGQPKVLYAVLHPNLWVAYDLNSGSMYKAWQGRVQFEEVTDSTVKERNATTDGYTYLEYDPQNVYWRVRRNGKTETPKLRYLGHDIDKNLLTIHREFILSDGTIFQLDEYPEYVPKKEGDMTGLERLFTLKNVPAGVEVSLEVDFDGMLFGSDIKTSGKIKNAKKEKRHYDWGSLYDFTGSVLLKSDEPTSLTSIFAINPELVVKRNQ
ncbi:MAG: hypothetical protein AAF206_06025 [Bacteroidota bacterium]